MKEIIPIRKTLYDNIKQMLAYATQELQNTERMFAYKYEHGFIYGHTCDYLAFEYIPKSRMAQVKISHYSTTLKFRLDKIVSYSSGKEDDITTSYLVNPHWCDAQELQKAAEITTRFWANIKEAIAQHKNEDYSINNFQI